MKYLLSILCLFIFSCDSGNSEIQGCTDSQACNYNSNTTIDNNSCEYVEENYDCDGNCFLEVDCNGECGGTAELDECGVCNGDGTGCGFAVNIILTNNSIPLSGADIFIKYLCGDFGSWENCAGNNSRPIQSIVYSIPYDGLVVINEYDLDDNLIRNLLNQYMQAGDYSFQNTIPFQDGIVPFGLSATKIKLEMNDEETEEYSIFYSAWDFYSLDNLGETDSNGQFFLGTDYLNSTSLPTFYNFNFTMTDEFGNALGNYNINQVAPSMKIFFLYDNVYKMFDIDLVNADVSYSFEWSEGEYFNPRGVENNPLNENESIIKRDTDDGLPSGLILNLFPNPYN